MKTIVPPYQGIVSKLLFAYSPECDLTCHARMWLMILAEGVSVVYSFELPLNGWA